MCVCVYVYIYIYIYREREREPSTLILLSFDPMFIHFIPYKENPAAAMVSIVMTNLDSKP